MEIRKLEDNDRVRWYELWDGYCRFYEREPSEVITEHLWKRIIDPDSSVYSIVAVRDDNIVIGIANYIIHENTSTLTPVCYLQDLFVDIESRASGVGRAMIDWLIAEMKANKWSRLYWNTKENNYRARQLYDTYTPQSGFLRYVIKNTESV